MGKAFRVLLKVNRYAFIFLLIALTSVTIIDVISRYFFNTSWIDAINISSFLLAMINSLALANVTMNKEHVQVELFVGRCPRKLRNIFSVANSLVASFLFFAMTWMALVKTLQSYKSGYSPGWMHLPEFPIRFIFAIGCLLTALAFLGLAKNAIRPEASKEKGDF